MSVKTTWVLCWDGGPETNWQRTTSITWRQYRWDAYRSADDFTFLPLMLLLTLSASYFSFKFKCIFTLGTLCMVKFNVVADFVIIEQSIDVSALNVDWASLRQWRTNHSELWHEYSYLFQLSNVAGFILVNFSRWFCFSCWLLFFRGFKRCKTSY